MSATGRFRTAIIKTADGRELSEAQRVEEIKALLKGQRHSYGAIGAQYGVSRSAVAGIAHRMRKAGLLAAAGDVPALSSGPARETRRRAELRELVGQGKSTREIAEIMGVEVAAIYGLAKRARISLNGRGGRKGVSEALCAQVIAAVKAGASAATVAERLLISLSTVYKIVADARAAGQLPPLEPRGGLDGAVAVVKAPNRAVPQRAVPKAAPEAVQTAVASLSKPVRRDLVNRLQAGQSANQLARLHGLELATVEEVAAQIATRARGGAARRSGLAEKIRELAAQRRSQAEIASLLGHSQAYISELVKLFEIPVVKQNGQGGVVEWSEAEREVLRAQAPRGIAAVMAALQPVKPHAYARNRTHSEINREAHRLGLVIGVLAAERAPDGAGVRFDELEARGCRWPLGVGPDGEERFCGAARDAAAGGSRAHYCAEHGARATVRAANLRDAKALLETLA